MKQALKRWALCLSLAIFGTLGALTAGIFIPKEFKEFCDDLITIAAKGQN